MFSKRVQSIDASGIRRIFDLAANLIDPVNLSIGQPDFDAFPAVKAALKNAVDQGKNSYTVTQGIPQLTGKLRNRYGLDVFPGGDNFDVFVTAGVSAGLMLSFMSLLDPGDEILIPDPFFVIYRDMPILLNANPVYYNTYPDFSLNAERIEAAITPRTKLILVNSPANPTGYAATQSELNAVIEVAKRRGIYLLFDEIYSCFSYDHPHVQCLGNYDKLILLNGFSKVAGVPGWRVGYVIAPRELCAQMLKVQQYSFVCANSAAQWAMIDALDMDFTAINQDYKGKRDFICDQLCARYEFVRPGGAFYLFPKAPGGDGQRFVEMCLENNLLVIPGGAFSRTDTHFRISFSASQQTLERGVEILNRLASSM